MKYELFDITYTLCEIFHTTPFEIFKQDTDEVIEVINFVIEKGERAKAENENRKTGESATEENERAFWDFI